MAGRSDGPSRKALSAALHGINAAERTMREEIASLRSALDEAEAFLDAIRLHAGSTRISTQPPTSTAPAPPRPPLGNRRRPPARSGAAPAHHHHGRPVAASGKIRERTPLPVNQKNLRQVIHDHMAQIAAQHAAAVYPWIMDGDTAAQLFALLTDAALAYQMEAEAELADPGPGQSLAAACGLSAKDAVLTGLEENLDLKDGNPAMAPVNGWLAWRAANEEDGPRS